MFIYLCTEVMDIEYIDLFINIYSSDWLSIDFDNKANMHSFFFKYVNHYVVTAQTCKIQKHGRTNFKPK